ncbi:histidine phosphatase family protein [Paenibacillus sp. UMB4589-SE434]|uniref:histidine phosphatase family protein n=1 Tax=Paenibacillus sp. UMB4589-SE434 TaxID=3046314 RepID=UPI00254A5846|nr:histidine phosphatase family protein [Paenibacillus sp. UMB4589-SE434]MDK8182955.1 histidine phosphatase family protein [Paenibacillus sp. UMB4589-SE434]
MSAAAWYFTAVRGAGLARAYAARWVAAVMSLPRAVGHRRAARGDSVANRRKPARGEARDATTGGNSIAFTRCSARGCRKSPGKRVLSGRSSAVSQSATRSKQMACDRSEALHKGLARNRGTAGNRRTPVLVRLYVARHGVTRANVERRYVSRSDVPLLPEAGAALRPLRRKLAARRPLAFASDMRRCVSTLAQVCPHGAQRAVFDERLRELDFGQWEGLTYSDLQADDHYRAWLDNMEAVVPPGGESWSSFEARTADAWQAILASALVRSPSKGSKPWVSRCSKVRRTFRSPRSVPLKDILIVTHGGVVRSLYTLAWPEASFWDMTVPTGGGYIIIAQRWGRQWRFLRTEPLV